VVRRIREFNVALSGKWCWGLGRKEIDCSIEF